MKFDDKKAKSSLVWLIKLDDCGAGSGYMFYELRKKAGLESKNYIGVEWDGQSVAQANRAGLQVIRADLNLPLPFSDETFGCAFGLSVLEHLVKGCGFLSEIHWVLKPGGYFILLTPNLSAWFNIISLIAGKMPTSGPHPDSAHLIEWNTLLQFREIELKDLNARHILVFTYKSMLYYLTSLNFRIIVSRSYGFYPFPKVIQNFFEKLDPWHCHQMVFWCQKKLNADSKLHQHKIKS